MPTTLPPPGAPRVLYVVDLSGYVFRAYHAVAPLSSPSGEPTHATHGTVAMLQRLVESRRPAMLAIAMDSKSPTFRKELDATYKANRPPPPPDLSVQMERCREIAEAYGVPIFQREGIEADDFVATVVRHARAAGLDVVIVSADKDLMQLVDEHVVLWDSMRDRVFGPEEVEQKFGVPPRQVRDLLALMGDSSDNVPGVPGVGEKTAAELLRSFGDLDGIYAHLGEIKRKKLAESLRDNEDAARLSQKLVTLRHDEPVEFDLAALAWGGADVAKLRRIYAELGFGRLLAALPAVEGEGAGDAPAAGAGEPSPARELEIRVAASRADLEALAAEARAAGRFSLELATTSDESMRAALVGIALVARDRHATYVPVGHRYIGMPAQLAVSDVAATLGPLLADPSLPKSVHDGKHADVALSRASLALAGVADDTMLAAYLLDSEAANDLPTLARRALGDELPTLAEPGAKPRAPKLGVDEREVERVAAYACARADAASRLAPGLARDLDGARLGALYREVELPLARVLAEMERAGVLVDAGELGVLHARVERELAALEKRAHEAAGREFNVASPRQLEAVLFDELGLRAVKKTKTGRSTDADVLEALEDEHPLPRIVLEHRQIAKLKGTYIDALPALVHPETGRIHTRWAQAVAATGRISSNDPNLQNIPVRTELGMAIRRAFVAPPGQKLVSADYSQIELRVLAHLSGDEVLVDAFRTGQDVHARTAMEIFGVAEDGVTDEMRRRAKTINFGVIYGMGEVALAKRLGIPRAEAASFIESYFARYAGVRRYMEESLAKARHGEAVRTLLGRRRLLADVGSTNPMLRAQAERMAQNTPIQGTAADILKLAMLKLASPVAPGARMVLTVHDELVFEVPDAHVDEARRTVRAAMEGVAELDVPLVVDVASGPNWGDLG